MPCEVCDAAVLAQSTGRPRRYCSRPCKGAAAVWRGVEAVIARARAAGDVEFADERAAPGSTRSTGGSDDDLTRGDPVHANRRMLLEYTVGDQLPDVALPWRDWRGALLPIRRDGRRRTYPPIAVIIAPGSSDTREDP
jgi:hypothetical protein